MPDIEHSTFKARPVPERSTIRVSLTVGVGEIAVELPASDASIIAAIALRAARDAATSDRGKTGPTALSVVSPSGYGAGLGRRPESLILHFQFGDATLGIELGKEEILTFGQRLMTLAAEGTAQ